MPFKSEQQHKLFRVLLAKGKISQETFDKWMKETKKKHGKKHPIKPLPENIDKESNVTGLFKTPTAKWLAPPKGAVKKLVNKTKDVGDFAQDTGATGQKQAGFLSFLKKKSPGSVQPSVSKAQKALQDAEKSTGAFDAYVKGTTKRTKKRKPTQPTQVAPAAPKSIDDQIAEMKKRMGVSPNEAKWLELEKGKTAAEKEEERGVASRAARVLPLPMAIGTGVHAYRNPDLFDPKTISQRFKPNTRRGKLMSGLLGAAVGAGVGWLPSMTEDAAKALYKSSAASCSKSKKKRAKGIVTAYERAKKAVDLVNPTSYNPTPPSSVRTMGTGTVTVPPPLPRLSGVVKDKGNPGSPFVTKSLPRPNVVKSVTTSKVMTPQSAIKIPEVGKSTKTKLA